jgi:hypothetical protein
MTWPSRDRVNGSRNTHVLLDFARLSASNSQMRTSRRYSIQVRDSKGSIIFTTTAIWGADDRRVAIAKIMRLEGVIEASSLPSRAPDQGFAMDFEAPTFSSRTQAKKPLGSETGL